MVDEEIKAKLEQQLRGGGGSMSGLLSKEVSIALCNIFVYSSCIKMKAVKSGSFAIVVYTQH